MSPDHSQFNTVLKTLSFKNILLRKTEMLEQANETWNAVVQKFVARLPKEDWFAYELVKSFWTMPAFQGAITGLSNLEPLIAKKTVRHFLESVIIAAIHQNHLATIILDDAEVTAVLRSVQMTVHNLLANKTKPYEMQTPELSLDAEPINLHRLNAQLSQLRNSNNEELIHRGAILVNRLSIIPDETKKSSVTSLVMRMNEMLQKESDTDIDGITRLFVSLMSIMVGTTIAEKTKGFWEIDQEDRWNYVKNVQACCMNELLRIVNNPNVTM